MMPMLFSAFLERCMSIPYRRDASIGEFGDAMNCYGFVYWFYRLCRCVELERTDVGSFSDIHCVEYEKDEIPRNGDVVDMRTMGGCYNYHVGIYMNGYVYHFGYNGPECKKASRIPHLIKGYYHVVED